MACCVMAKTNLFDSTVTALRGRIAVAFSVAIYLTAKSDFCAVTVTSFLPEITITIFGFSDLFFEPKWLKFRFTEHRLSHFGSEARLRLYPCLLWAADLKSNICLSIQG